MRANLLLEILQYYIVVEESSNLITEYQALISLLTQARQSPSPDISNKLSVQKQKVFDILDKSEPKDWPYSKRKLFNILNEKGLIGYQAIKRINDTFQSHQADPNGVVQEITIIVQELTQFKTKYTNIVDIFQPLLDQYKEDQIESGQTVLYLFFENDAVIKTIKDLQNASKEWNISIRSFARLASDSVQDAQIYSIDQGSIIIGLLAGIATATALAKGINEILKVYEKVLIIRKLQLETKKLKLDTNFQKIYEAEITTIIESAAEKASEKLFIEFFGDKTSGRGDIRNGISIALRKIFEFIEKGGKIDYQEKEEEDKKVKIERQKLAESFNKIKELENNIKEIKSLLEKNPDK